jgi:hypothetical protein
LLSIAALADIGYTVDPTQAESHFPNLITRDAPQGDRIVLRERLYRKGIPIN